MYANVLRAGTLSDDRVIKRVSASFVPTHYNNNDPTRDKSSPSALLWRSITRQKGLQGQGIWIVAPDGHVIAGMSAEVGGHPSERAGNGPGAPWKANPRFADAVVEMLDQSLSKFGPVTKRVARAQPLPFRGAGVRPDGGVRLVAYNRSDGGLAFSVPLTKEQWQAFAPPKAAAGEKWALPESVARQFAPVISPYADTRFRPKTDELSAAAIHAVVESVDERHARVRLTGRWRADWTHDGNEHSIASMTADGLAIYNLEAKSIRSLVLLCDGSYSYTSKPGQKVQAKSVAAVVRWRLDGEAE